MPDPLATLTDRLYTAFQPGLTHADIDRIVAGCRADLDGTPETALPELLERLARQRLANLTDQRENATAAPRDDPVGGSPSPGKQAASRPAAAPTFALPGDREGLRAVAVDDRR